MRLELITLLGKKVDQQIYSATLPTVDGEISVFPSHEPLVTLAAPGVVSVHFKKDDDTEVELYAISGGVIEINHQGIRILVDEADHGEDIVEAETRAALELAIKMRDEATSQIELEKAHQLVDRHKVKLKVAELRRRKRR